MSELKIGEYTVETQAYYDALVEENITDEKILKKLDTNNDKKLTEDELSSLDSDSEEGTKKTSSDSEDGDSEVSDDEKYESTLASLKKVLNDLEDQRDEIISDVGIAQDMDTLDNNLSGLSDINSSISEARNDIFDLMNDHEYAEECARKLAQYQSVANGTSDDSSSSSDSTSASASNGSGVNRTAKISFDFKEKMCSRQKTELPMFVSVWNKNKSRYEKVAKRTGVPAELIAAIHWRESGCNFNTYLHNGDPLGQPTTHVPAGKLFYNWEDAAVDALKSQSYKVDPNNIETWYEYAERYNGLGYRNRGIASPYVWSGTTNYTSGRYVADGQFSATAVDEQLGVALMLKAIVK